jgi:hypothetical protein
MNMALLIGLWRALSKPKEGGMWKRIERTPVRMEPVAPLERKAAKPRVQVSEAA